MKTRPLALLAGLALLLPTAAGARAALDPKIGNGLLTSGFPAVGLLFGGGGPTCTVTLIGCRTALTAAHCVCPPFLTCVPSPAGRLVFFQNAGTFAVSSLSVHPEWDVDLLGVHDLALIRLAAPVAGVLPAPLNTAGKPGPGTASTLVGFGRAFAAPGGIKRQGQVEIVSCDPSSLCHDYQPPLGPPGTDSTACAGDSGGPLFVASGDGLALAGVTSGALGPGSADCSAPVQGVESDVFVDHAWIAAQAGDALGQPSCGDAPNAGSAAAPTAGVAGTLDAAHPESRFTFEVPAGTGTLQVQLNAERDPATDFDLYVRHGGPASPASFDCQSRQPGTAPEGCTLEAPAPGTWHLTAQRVTGAGLFQLTATAFAERFAGPCTRDAATACLQSERFEVTASWQNPQAAGTAQVMSFGGRRAENDESVFLYFQALTNFELGVKVLNACIPALGNKFWVFTSGLTDQGWTVRVRDTRTGAVKTYSNPVGRLSSTFADTAAFDCL